jgi:hypothetical protein
MFLSLPVFAFDCIYNRYTTENKCVYWSNADELYAYISHYENAGLAGIARNMKIIADNRYRWNTIVAKYESLFG